MLISNIIIIEMGQLTQATKNSLTKLGIQPLPSTYTKQKKYYEY